MFKIATLRLKSNLMLSPMAGVTDLPFREINRKFGCELAFTEMLNVRSMSYKSRKTRQMLFSSSKDRPLGVQLLGLEEKYILKGLDVLENYKFDLLNFNAACPVKKVVARGEGSALLKEPDKLKKILELLVRHSKVPVSLKIRTGWDGNSVNAKEIALLAQDSGVSALIIHGRTRQQGYGGKVDYQTIGAVKKAVEIPVIASGDIFNAGLAKKMLDETGADGLAIARGALGNPWIFKEIKEFLSHGKITARPDRKEISRTMAKHLKSYVNFYGEKTGVVKFRKFFIWYTKGFRYCRHLRNACSTIKAEMPAINLIHSFAEEA
ncbi:MAG: tRNA dihydrouridine synthase DusB [Candidatus Omnitrophota bacterium]